MAMHEVFLQRCVCVCVCVSLKETTVFELDLELQAHGNILPSPKKQKKQQTTCKCLRVYYLIIIAMIIMFLACYMFGNCSKPKCVERPWPYSTMKMSRFIRLKL